VMNLSSLFSLYSLDSQRPAAGLLHVSLVAAGDMLLWQSSMPAASALVARNGANLPPVAPIC